MYTAYAVLEQQLESLGQRWAAVCKWVEDQWVVLQEAMHRWQHFNQDVKQFSDWLSEKENMLARMRLTDLSDANQVIERVRMLKVSYGQKCDFLTTNIFFKV